MNCLKQKALIIIIFLFFPDDKLFNENNFYKFCKYDYFFFADQCLANHQIDINFETIDYKKDISYITTPLAATIIKKSNDVVKLLLEHPEIDINYQFTT